MASRWPLAQLDKQMDLILILVTDQLNTQILLL